MDHDPLTTWFWQGAAEGVLLVQRCEECGHHQFYPRPFCLRCESDRVVPIEASGAGTLYSFTVVHVSTGLDVPPPYAVGLVTLDEGPRLLARLVGLDHTIGDRVTVRWRDGNPHPVFGPAARPASR